jgi:hypothetical protein
MEYAIDGMFLSNFITGATLLAEQPPPGGRAFTYLQPD